MNYQSEFTWEEALKLVDYLVYKNTKKHLREIEVEVLRGVWQKKKYETIACEGYVTCKHIGDVAFKLWKKLSEELGEEVKRKNVCTTLERVWKDGLSPDPKPPRPEPLLPDPEPPAEPYVQRLSIESACYKEICRLGSLLRIKAPLEFGKTELMSRVVHHADQQGYRTVVLNLREVTREEFGNLAQFLQWFCNNIAVNLELTVRADEQHWDKSLGSSQNRCKNFFLKYLLPGDCALAIFLDDLDKLYFHKEIAADFLGMLRTWHEYAKASKELQQLRLVISYAEVFTDIDLDESPFNAGEEIELPDFSQEEVLSLAQQYLLNWDNTQAQQLMAMVGGHPCLVVKACQVVVRQDMTLEQVLQTAPTAAGIYHQHLQRHWRKLRANSQLASDFKKVVFADAPVQLSQLNFNAIVRLKDLGLIKLENNAVMPRYELYQQYFRFRFGNT
jgi:hypothetical protein